MTLNSDTQLWHNIKSNLCVLFSTMWLVDNQSNRHRPGWIPDKHGRQSRMKPRHWSCVNHYRNLHGPSHIVTKWLEGALRNKRWRLGVNCNYHLWGFHCACVKYASNADYYLGTCYFSIAIKQDSSKSSLIAFKVDRNVGDTSISDCLLCRFWF